MKPPVCLLLLCALSSTSMASALNPPPIRAGCSIAELSLAKQTAQQALSEGDTRFLWVLVREVAMCHAFSERPS